MSGLPPLAGVINERPRARVTERSSGEGFSSCHVILRTNEKELACRFPIQDAVHTDTGKFARKQTYGHKSVDDDPSRAKHKKPEVSVNFSLVKSGV